jgi:hypothetical protein
MGTTDETPTSEPLQDGVVHGPMTEMESYRADYKDLLLEGPVAQRVLEMARNFGDRISIALGTEGAHKAKEKQTARTEVRREIEEQAVVSRMRIEVKELFVKYNERKGVEDARKKKDPIGQWADFAVRHFVGGERYTSSLVLAAIIETFAEHLVRAGDRAAVVLEAIINLSNEHHLFQDESQLIEALHLKRHGYSHFDPVDFDGDLNSLKVILPKLFPIEIDNNKTPYLEPLRKQAAARALTLLAEKLERAAYSSDESRQEAYANVLDIVGEFADIGLWEIDDTMKQLHTERNLKFKQREGAKVDMMDLSTAVFALEGKEMEPFKEEYRRVLLEGSRGEKALQKLRNFGNEAILAMSWPEDSVANAEKKRKAMAEVRREIAEQTTVLKMRIDVKVLFLQYDKAETGELRTTLANHIINAFARHLDSAGAKADGVLAEIIRLSNEHGLFGNELPLMEELHIKRKTDGYSANGAPTFNLPHFSNELDAIRAILPKLYPVKISEDGVKSLNPLRRQAAAKALSVLADILNHADSRSTEETFTYVHSIVAEFADKGLWDIVATMKQLHIERSLKLKKREGANVNIKDLTTAILALEAKAARKAADAAGTGATVGGPKDRGAFL